MLRLAIVNNLSWVVWKRNSEWGLYIRDYPAQGENPSYFKVRVITKEFAQYLDDNRLANDLYGQLEDE